MKIKDWPAWLKGGVIGASIGLLTFFAFLVLYFFNLDLGIFNLFFLPFSFIQITSMTLLWYILEPVINTLFPGTCRSIWYFLLDCENSLLGNIIEILMIILPAIFSIIFYGFIGAPVGYLIGDIKAKPHSSNARFNEKLA